jgi:glycosyltransferase involved in cell wall biosynthesis
MAGADGMSRICLVGAGQPAHAMRLYHRYAWTLARAGHDVELIAHGDGGPDPAPFRITDLGPMGASTLRWRAWSRVHRCQQAYRLARRNPADLYVFFSPELIPWAIRLRRRSGAPVIFDCREDFIGYARQRAGIPEILRGPIATVIARALRLAARHVDVVTVADDGTGEQFRSFGAEVVTVYNFPRLELFPAATADTMARREFDLVYHGTMPRYNLRQILAIDTALLALGREARWYLFGSSPELGWFDEQLRSRGAAERFVVGGRIPHDHVFAEVQRARIGLIPLPRLPKFLNNIPQKLFEYMALGLPVVLSDLPPSRPFVEGSGAGVLVDPDDPAAYARAIVQLLDDPEACAAMGRRGRELVEDRWNWESEARKLNHLVDRLVADAPRRTIGHDDA